MFDIRENLKKLPDKPGVYLMKDENEKVIYVGKAISLKNRVRQYFNSSKNHSSKVVSMVCNISSFEYIITDSELEALILECNLIKEYRPKYNILLRDDKTYPYIKITTNEDYPRILKVRKVLKDNCKYFGPYTNITALNDTLEVIKNILPIRTCNIDIKKAIKNNVRPCLNLHINKCVGPCTGNVKKEEYNDMINDIVMFLSGKEEKLINNLKEKMNELSIDLKFEEASIYRDKIRSLEEILNKQKIDTTISDLDQDVIAMSKILDEACVQIFFVRNGKIVGREHFIFEGVKDSDNKDILTTFVKQFYINQEYIPRQIIIEEEIEDIFLLSEYLSSKKGRKVEIRVPKKGEKRSLIQLVKKNSLEYLEKFNTSNRLKYEKSIGVLEKLKDILDLENIPKRIEAFDISNISGVDSIGAMVVFIDGKKEKKEYRKYKIKTVVGMDDYSSMKEVLKRRLKQDNLPDLILLDGGKGQVSAVKKILKENIPVWGMYKDDKHKTKGLINLEKDIVLDKSSDIYRFVASIQEEVHNYAINYHRSIRNKSLTKSVLDDIQGIGEKRKKSLISHFKDIKNIEDATVEQLLEVEGMNRLSAQNVYDFFKNMNREK